MFLKLAWRNIWRKKWRSAITLTSIAFAVFFAILMRSMQLGMYDKMIDNMVRFWSGYAQIHATGYQDEKILDNSMEWNEALMLTASETKHVDAVVPRLEGFALGSSGLQTKGVMVVGSDLKKEDQMLGLSDKLIKGNLPGPTDKSVIIGKGLSKYFGISAGDTLILLGQGYHGVSAAGKYPVGAVVKFSSKQMDDNLVLLPLLEAQWFFGAENRISSLALLVDKEGNTEKVIQSLNETIDSEQFEILGWKEMMPELVQTIQADSAGGIIMLMILYMIITFGMFGTVLMMTAERQYEFGVLVSIGMRRTKIAFTLFLETIMMSTVGVLIGAAISMPLQYWIAAHPIPLEGQAAETMLEYGLDPAIILSTDYSIAITHGLIIIAISLVISIYPSLKIQGLKPVEAMRK